MRLRLRRRTRFAVAAVALLLAGPPIGLVGWDVATHNLGAVETGRVYRSAQMTAPALGRTVRELGVKTVLNLRGGSARSKWYPAERAATTAAGATQVDVAMSSCEWMSRAQMRAVVRVLETCRRPLLIHCQWGSERTGLVSALATLLRPGSTLDDARRQFSVRYLYLPVGDGRVMREHLSQYERWLAARGFAHSPERFREWAAKGYTPGLPGRESWPYDPYPLVVVTPPPPASPSVWR
jgi:protein tyrosine phosphatase (PTP) superfamily phosphohydrolase (DUF442 family)